LRSTRKPRSSAAVFASFLVTASLLIGGSALRADAQTTPTRGLDLIFNESGKVSLSMNALGTNSNEGQLKIVKPAGATVRRAVLFAATTGTTNFKITPATPIVIDGVTVPMGNEVPTNISSFNYWTDVTARVKPKIDGSVPGDVSFTIGESFSQAVDGTVLAVIFDDPNVLETKSVALLFGALKTTGDEFTVGLEKPVTASSELVMSLGISYGYQDSGAQYSTVSVNNQLLTSAAGGSDDGSAVNGALITVGGVGDSSANPADPSAFHTGPRSDDELYDLRPFVPLGATSLSIRTANPSNDDNIFMAALVSNPPAGSIVVDNDCEDGVPAGPPIVVPVPPQTLAEKLTTVSHPASAPISIALPAGVYAVTQGSFDDAHPQQEDQVNESWFAEFYDAAGVSVGVTATSPDLDRTKTTDAWSTGSIVLRANVASVVFRHSPGGEGPDSVYPNVLELTSGGQYPPKPPCPPPVLKPVIPNPTSARGPEVPGTPGNGNEPVTASPGTPVEATPVFTDPPVLAGASAGEVPGTARSTEPTPVAIQVVAPSVAVSASPAIATTAAAAPAATSPEVASSVEALPKVEVLGIEIENAAPALATSTPSAQVAFTGTESMGMFLMATVLIGFGVFALGVARRRRS
jgi:hypothetical protein